jgi:hypothetical protein
MTAEIAGLDVGMPQAGDQQQNGNDPEEQDLPPHGRVDFLAYAFRLQRNSFGDHSGIF